MGSGATAGAAVGGYGLLGILRNVNMNITTDNTIPMVAASYNLRRITMTNASISLTTAAGGIYTAASKGGTAVVAAGQVYSSLTAPTISLDLTLAVSNVITAANPLFLNLTTAQGAAATADLYIYGERIS